MGLNSLRLGLMQILEMVCSSIFLPDLRTSSSALTCISFICSALPTKTRRRPSLHHFWRWPLALARVYESAMASGALCSKWTR